MLNVKFVLPVAAEFDRINVFAEYPEATPAWIDKRTFEITFVFPGNGIFAAVVIFEFAKTVPSTLVIRTCNLFIKGNGVVRNPVKNWFGFWKVTVQLVELLVADTNLGGGGGAIIFVKSQLSTLANAFVIVSGLFILLFLSTISVPPIEETLKL